MNYIIRYINKTNALIILLLVTGFIANAQTTKVLTLDEAIKLGVDNSRQLKISQSKANAAGEKYKEYEANEIPSVKINAGYTRLSPIDPFTVQFPGFPEPITLFPVILNN